ncbi:hypothetical protein CPC197_2198 [Chlamydia psittaci C1/97]|nr:hypothetical protein CPC197_2198 [Chlamydia psittaci C1/97]
MMVVFTPSQSPIFEFTAMTTKWIFRPSKTYFVCFYATKLKDYPSDTGSETVE